MKVWIVRNYNKNKNGRRKKGELYLYAKKPILDYDNNTFNWRTSDGSSDGRMKINSSWFKDITFENSPQRIELKEIINEKAASFKHIKLR